MARGSQVTRQWKILRMLETSGRGLTAQELCEQIGGGKLRTFQRDLKDLQQAGFPLFDEDERWRVLRPDEGGYTTPIDPSELLALLVTEELFEPLGSTEIAAALTRLRTKLTAMLDPRGREYVAEVRNNVLATFSAPGQYESRSDDVRAIEEAIQKQHHIDIRYWSPEGGETERRVDPYTLWFADGRLYVVGWCHLRTDFRTFSLDRIRAVNIVDEDFEPDPTFDARRYTSGGFGVWSGAPERVVVEFDREFAHLPKERRYHPTQKLEELEDGVVRMTMQVSGIANVAAWVASFGGSVVAKSPERLVMRVIEIFGRGLVAHTEASHAKNPRRDEE